MAKAYREARTTISKGVDGYKAELLKGRPDKPEAYAFKPEGKIAERLAKSNLVILADKPGADFKPEAGKQYLALKADDPMLAYWRKTAFEAGMSQEQFAEGLVTYAESMVGRQPSEADTQAAAAAEFAKLGENGQARAAHVWGRLQTVLGKDAAGALDGQVTTAEGIAALEVLLEKAGEPKFSPAAGATSAQQDTGALLLEAKRLQGDVDYWSNAEKQKRVTEIFAKAYPGPSTGITPGSKLGPAAGRAA